MAITASFSPGTGVLSEFGDNLDNTITTSRDAAGNILVNGGTVPGTPTVANTTLIQVLGQDGDDKITLDESVDALPAANLSGGDGNDVLTGGAGDDQLFGGKGNDTLLGKGGSDQLFGGDGSDVLTGGDGNDKMFGEGGDDRMIWNPGDDNDLMEGGAGTDTAEVNGGNGAEVFTVTANGARVDFERVSPAPFSLDIGTTEKLVLNANGGADDIVINDLTGTDVKQVAIDLGGGQLDTVTVNGRVGNDQINVGVSGTMVTVGGLSEQVTIGQADPSDLLSISGGAGNDTINASGLPAGTMTLTLDGGAGNDTVTGSAGADTLIGGVGDDAVTGGAGNDVALLGAGNDLFIWNPGDGSDIVEGQADLDTLEFNGSNASENIAIAANGQRVSLTSDVGNVVMDVNGVEHIELAPAGGADSITVSDLTGTGVTQVALDLDHGQADRVNVVATAGADVIAIGRSDGEVTVSGLAETITIAHADSHDQLTVSAGTGDDVIDASNLPAGQISLTVNGGDGDDVITGSHGDDTVVGGRGNDVAFLGDGNDLFVWNPGEGSDFVNGQAGFDTLDFNGAVISENINISANGSLALFTRDVAAITMDLNGLEHIQFNALGGADHITVNDLTGTDVKQVDINLAGTLNGSAGDGAADTVTVNGSAGNDRIDVNASGTVVTVSGLSAQVTVDHADSGDHLSINGGAGNDTINASKLPTGTMDLTLDGGAGNDVLIGGNEKDTFQFTFGVSGQDVVQGFQTHGASTQGDVVALAGFSDHTFDQAIADGHIAQSGADVVLSDGANVFATLQHISLASLHANDFLFT